MTGNGSRFVNAGYKDLKPLILVQGRPIIDWIVSSMLSPSDDLYFVCRKEHLLKFPNFESKLKSIAPQSTILTIDIWEKKGPVFDIMKISEKLDDSKPTVISYCDYFMNWNWEKFKTEVIERGCDGAVPTYTGFHPHLIPEKNLYASCQVDKDDNLIEIREKYSFEIDKSLSRHSPGLYYFKTGALMKHYYQQAINIDLSLNGEYYSSLPYNLLVKDSLKVWVPINVKHFCQWGTPEDLKDYLFWSELVKGFKK